MHDAVVSTPPRAGASPAARQSADWASMIAVPP